MQAIIITIGDEILYGQTVDTNSAWIAHQLNLLGISVYEIVSITDEREHILAALQDAHQKADFVLMTGGLGPTRDDITKHTLAEYFNSDLVRDEDIYQNVQEIFNRRKLAFLESNKAQADIPEKCTPIPNKHGTAPGMWFEENDQFTVSMPGVPHEMKAMVTNFVIPRLRKSLDLPYLEHRFIMTAGMGESSIADVLENFEDNLPENVFLAYLPSLAQVKLRLTARGEKAQVKQQLDELEQKIREMLPKFVYATGAENTLPVTVGHILREKGWRLATAESCTGGNIAHEITAIAGSSDYFEGSIVSYSNEMKMHQLDVKPSTLEKHGAVSEETVREMVAGTIQNLGVDIAVAVSGIAGPSGGSKEKPVGTVWVAIGDKQNVETKLLQLKGDRLQIIERTTTIALCRVWRFLNGITKS